MGKMTQLQIVPIVIKKRFSFVAVVLSLLITPALIQVSLTCSHAFWRMSKSIDHVQIKNYMIISAYGMMLMFTYSTVLVIPISNIVNAATPNLFPSSINKALSVKWWQWLFSIPPKTNPILDDNPCNVKQSGSFFYLVGTFGGTADRNCTIPKNKAIFFPIINIVATFDKNDPNFNTLDKVRKAASDFINGATDLKVSVDGISIKNIANLRAQSPAFKLKVPADNIGGPPDTYIAVSDGFWVALKPLSVGEHTIHFAGNIPDSNFNIDVTYHITVK